MKTLISILALSFVFFGAACSGQSPSTPEQAEVVMEGDMANSAAKAAPATMDTKQVQKLLKQKGAKLKVDGKMGPATKKALADFQAAQGLPATGELDAETIAKLQG